MEFSEEEESDEEESQLSGRAAGTCAGLKYMFCKCISMMLVFVPIAWALHFSPGIGSIYNFCFNFLAIIPLAWVISESTEHLEKIVGPMLGTLLNSTFGNVVEIILSITAIKAGLVKIVQSSLIGAMMMNTTGVLGLCFFVAGIQYRSKKFNMHQATYNLAMLALSSLALVVPTGLAVFDDWSTPTERLTLSRFVAGCLFCMYLQWLAFNLSTHAELFDTRRKNDIHWFWARGSGAGEESPRELQQLPQADPAVEDELMPESSAVADEDEEPGIHWVCACLMLLIATVLVAFHCDWLVESINPVCEQFGVKKAFVATVLLPMVGNFSEVIAAVTIASKGKLDLAMGVAIGSATQIALCVIPVAIFIAWCYEQPLDLDFEFFQVKLFFFSLLVIALLLLDGEANWLKGSLLISAYLMIASSFWFMHDREFASAGLPPGLIEMNRTSLNNHNSLSMRDRRLAPSSIMHALRGLVGQ